MAEAPDLDLDRPDPEDLGTAGDWLAGKVHVLLIFDTETDSVVIDPGRLPRTFARSIVEKAWRGDDDPETWGDEPEPEEDEWEDDEA